VLMFVESQSVHI